MIRSTARVASFWFALAAFNLLASSAFAQPKATTDVQALGLEVAALQTLYRLDLTDAQLEMLQRLAKDAASPMKNSGQTKTTPAFVKALGELRGALLKGDDQRIDDVKEKVAEIMERDKIQIDDRVAISDSGRRGATFAIRMLQPSQVLAYLQVMDEDDVDLYDVLGTALDRGDDVSAAQWKTLRDQTAANAAWLLVGSDEARSRATAKALAALLDQHHVPQNGKTPDLEKQVQQITASLDPFVMLRNAMERDIAELLSNPRLPGAIQHTITQRKKAAAK